MERPLLTGYDKEIGTLRCSGQLSLDLPPGVAVVGGRRTLRADIDYVLQAAGDGSGDVVILEGADAIIVPLATLAPAGTDRALPAPSMAAPIPGAGLGAPAGQPPPEVVTRLPQDEAALPRPAPATAQTSRSTGKGRPSFNCRYAKTKGEIAVCNNGALAALDRQMAAQFYRAIASADARKRRLLTSTRDQFLSYRDRCPSQDCIADTYRGRMRQIEGIMENGGSR